MIARATKERQTVEVYRKNEENLSSLNNNDKTQNKPLNSNTLPKMSKPKQDRPRHSLQPQSNQPILAPLRHTKSQNYDKKSSAGGARKKPSSTIPTIHEVDSESASGEVEIVNEKRKDNKKQKRESVVSTRSRRSSGYDNAGFEGSTGNLTTGRQQQFRRSSGQQSFMSTTSSVKDTSVRSLPVIREQYCCCSRWSSCEKILITVVAILAVMIIALVIAVSLLMSDREGVSQAFQWSS